VILRGYGDDEPLVHKTLNPGVPVIVGADRVAAIAEAAAAGADVAVLDDAFQHRRARRAADLVLVSADRWTGETHLLPAGPWREPLTAIRRASLVVVTRKAASDATVEEVHRRIAEVAPAIPRLSVHLAPGELVPVAPADRSTTRSLGSIAGKRVHAVLSIGDPSAFIAQIESWRRGCSGIKVSRSSLVYGRGGRSCHRGGEERRGHRVHAEGCGEARIALASPCAAVVVCFFSESRWSAAWEA